MAAARANSTADILTGTGFVQSQGFEGEASSIFWFGLQDFEQLEQPISGNPNMMSEMIDIPATQNLLNDPRVCRNVMMNNMWTREAINRNPEFVYILKIPARFVEEWKV